jgi:hypothetical protein
MNKPVTFPIAKLLKERRFDEICEFGFHLDGSEHDFKKDWLGLQKNSYLAKNYFTRPTIADVIMWLYEKHGIWVFTFRYSKAWQWKVDDETSTLEFSTKGFNSPTEAYLAGIEYTLNTLI